MIILRNLIIMFISLVVFTSNLFSQVNQQTYETSELSYAVELNKIEYFLLEPVFVNFKLTNISRSILTIEKPIFLLDSILTVEFPSGEKREIDSMSLSSGRPQHLPGNKSKLQPLQVYDQTSVLPISSNILVNEGKYKLKFSLNGITSNTLEITVNNPTGIDKEAFDFLNKYETKNTFNWVWEEKNGISILEEFVSKYGNSVYGEQAISYLGNIYKAKGQFDKAQTEFEKLKSSKNKVISDEAKKAIEEIRTRKVCLENIKQPQ